MAFGLLAAVAPSAGAQSEPDACAGTEGAGRLTPDNEQWPNRDRIAALKTSNPDLWRKVCRDLPHPPANGDGAPVLVSNLGRSTDAGAHQNVQDLGIADRRQPFTTGDNASGYLLNSVDVAFRRLGASAAFENMTVTIRDAGAGAAVGTLVNPKYQHTASERSYRFESWEAANGQPGGIRLAPSTTYTLVFDRTQTVIGDVLVAVTDSDSEDSGAASGFGIGDDQGWRVYTSNGSFTQSNHALKIGLNGTPRPSGAPPWVRITTTDAAEGGNVKVTAELPAAHSEALSFWVDMRECGWRPPTGNRDPYEGIVGHDAIAACQAQKPGDSYASEADFNMWHPDGSARAFIHIPPGATSGELRFPAVTGDGNEGRETIAFMINPYGKATRAYLGYASGRQWHHPATPPDGYSGQRHPLWVASITADVGGSPTDGTLVPDGAQVGQGRTQSAPAVDAALIASVRDLAGQTHHGTAHVNRWRRVLIAFGVETYDGLTATTAQEANDNAAKYHSPLWPQIADVLTALETPDPPQDPPQQDQQDPPQQDQQGQQGDSQQDQQQDPPQQGQQAGYTVDPDVIAAVRALAGQSHHGPVHVNRWNRVLVAFGEHDGTGVTGGPITLDEAEQNTKTYSSPVWQQVVTELTNLAAAQ